jgi:hypothetical protein
MSATEAPRWDGHRMVFELVPAMGGAPVRFAISRLVLMAVSGGGAFRGADMLQRFAAARPRIEAAALAKLHDRIGPPLGILHIWEDEIAVPPA